ncbi:MAG TPA: DUF2298 domain-containing protein [Candidatus Sulfotelmatobacter sp.]|jgi:YYY domain-containing protein|nr:DUF2298 domain-containing protein [Candidatus Sulfotelmatobacter sp.]
MDLLSIISVIDVLLFFALFTCIGFPYILFIFPHWKDKGFPFAKLLLLCITAYIVWLLASLKLLHFSTITVMFVLLTIGLGAVAITFKKHTEIDLFLKGNWKLLVYEEIIFLFFFGSFLFIRWLNPDLWHPVMGGEKPMDFAFLNAILKSQTFPPYDPWYAGDTINYYYFGQYLIAIFTKLTTIPSSIFYNIALAYLFGQCASTIFSIIFHITASRRISILGSIFTIALGNLAQIPLIIKSFSEHIYINSWYWTATRVMPNYEINEFPYFTFLYADLHAHLIALVLNLFLIALIISLFTMHKITKSYLCIFLLLTSMLLGMLRATNIWDYPTYYLFIIIGLFFSVGLIRTIIMSLGIFSISNLTMLPFIFNYKTAPITINFYSQAPTRLEDYLLIHGFFLFILITFLTISLLQSSTKKKYGFLLLSISVLLGIFIPHYAFILVVGLLILLHLFLLVTQKQKKTQHILVLFFSGFAFFLTLIPDLIDIPVGLGRMNMVFKFYFQAWIFFALASALSLPMIGNYLHKQNKILRISWRGIFIILFLSAFSYIPTATYAKVKDRMSLTAPHTLDGMTYMQSSIYYDQGSQLTLLWDYRAIRWMNEHISPPAIILEGNTPIYRWGNRVSIYTGLQTVIGWGWHEQAHRSYMSADNIDKRIADVKLAYETSSIKTLLSIVRQYNIRYIYLGQLEKAYYNNEGFTKFNANVGSLFDLVYQNQEVTIYKVK